MAVDPSSLAKDLRPLTLNHRSVLPTPISSSSDPIFFHPVPSTSTAAAPWTHTHHSLCNGHADPTPPAPAAAVADEMLPEEQPCRKVKFLCSFGGKILPRPSDGALRYVGGHTRIIAIRKGASFANLMQKMVEVHGGTSVLKYQLPDEDLDALVTVSCAEDLDNMMEEYDKLAEGSQDGSAKLRVFLFSPSELESSASYGQFGGDLGQETGQRYVDAVNGIVEPGVLLRKDSNASASSTQNSDGAAAVEFTIDPGVSEGTSVAHQPLPISAISADFASLGYVNGITNPPAVPASNVPGAAVAVAPPQSLSPPIRPEQVQPAPPTYPTQTYAESHQEGLNYVSYVTSSGHLQYVASQQIGIGGAPLGYVAVPSNSFVSGMPTATTPSTQIGVLRPLQERMEPLLEESAYGGLVTSLPNEPNGKSYQTLSQLPPLPPSSVQASHIDRYGVPFAWHAGAHPQHGAQVRLEECFMCQKALPHAHSDTSVQNLVTCSANNLLVEANPVFHSLQPEDVLNYAPPPSVVSTTISDDVRNTKVEETVVGLDSTHLESGPVSNTAKDAEMAVSHGVENADVHRPVIPSSDGGFPGDLQRLYDLYPGQQHQFLGDILQHPLPSHLAPLIYTTRQETVPSVGEASQSHHVSNLGLAPGHYAANQGSLTSKGVSAHMIYRNEMPQNLDASYGDIRTETSHGQLTPIEAMMETLRTPPEMSVPFEQQKLNGNPNSGFSKGLKSEHSLAAMEHRENTQLRSEENDLLLSNAFANSGNLLEGNLSMPTDRMPPTSVEVTSINNIQLMNHVTPLLGDHGMPLQHLGTSGEPPIPPRRLLEPSNSGSRAPFGDWIEQASKIPSNYTCSDPIAAVNGNYPVPSCSEQNVKSGDLPVSDPLDTFFNTSDAWGIVHDTQVPSPEPKRVNSLESLVNGLGKDNHSDYTSLSANHVPSDKANYSKSQAIPKDDSLTELIQPIKDELIPQEKQAVAQNTVASIPHSSKPSTVVVSSPDKNESAHECTNSRDDQGDGMDQVDNNSSNEYEAENDEPNLVEKLKFEYQFTEEIERLQVIKNNDLEELRELGSGTFGTVYHGKWRGTDVAIKRINNRCFTGKPSDKERLADFWNEAGKLSDLHHPNVVAFYGVVLDGPGGSVATVTEYMVNGSLRSALQRNYRAFDRRKRVLIATDVAFGMEYLHAKKIVHFDLKSDNLLVNLRDPQRPICKVGDLGLSKVKCQTLISGGVRGTLPWMAPELLSGASSLVSEKVDVFSFGIVMWELLTGEEPYADLHYGAILGGIVSNTLRPVVPESCDPDWRSLMETCWSAEPSERPSFTEIANRLRSMATSPTKTQPQPNPPTSTLVWRNERFVPGAQLCT